MRRRLFASSVCSALLALTTASVSAQATPAPPPSGIAELTPPYAAKVRQGMEALMAGNPMVAESALREAVALDDGKAAGHYYLGVALRAQDQLEPALEQFRRAATLGAAASQPIDEARALVGAAETLDHMDGRLAEVRITWLEVLRVARAHPEALRPEVAEARVQAVDQILELAEVSRQVRERQAAREEELRQQAAEEAARPSRRPR
jgi:tetratricopeptide (TPR) repeat protein